MNIETRFVKPDKHGVYDIIGMQIETSEDGSITETGWEQMNEILNIYRDKRCETFRYLFIGPDGKIRNQIALSAQLPDMTYAYPSSQTLYSIKRYAEATGSRLIFVHNHPNGDPSPSDADIETTKSIGDFFNADEKNIYAGHMILDHGKYTATCPDIEDGKWLPYSTDEKDKADPLVKETNNEILKAGYLTRTNIQEIGREISGLEKWNTKGWIPVAFTHGNTLTMTKIYPVEWFLEASATKIKEEFQLAGADEGSNHAVPFVLPENMSPRLQECLKRDAEEGCFLDVYYGGQSLADMGLEGKGKSYYTETAQSRAQENLTVDSTIPLGTLERYSAGGVIREENEEKERTNMATVTNSKNKSVHYRNSNGFEKTEIYDEQGKLVSYKDSKGTEWQREFEYDEKGNIIHYKSSREDEWWKKYDERGNEIYFENSSGFKEWKKYDEHGNLTYSRNSDGEKTWHKYDEHGNEIYSKDSNGKKWSCKYEYDEKGNVTHFKNSGGYEEWKEYDEKGNLTYSKNSHGFEEWREYDEKANLTYSKASDGTEEWNEYDEKGNVTHYKKSDGKEWWKEYDEHGNELHYKKSDGYEERKKYDDEGNLIHLKDSNGFEEWNEIEDKTKEIEKNISERQKENIMENTTLTEINEKNITRDFLTEINDTYLEKILGDENSEYRALFEDNKGILCFQDLAKNKTNSFLLKDDPERELKYCMNALRLLRESNITPVKFPNGDIVFYSSDGTVTSPETVRDILVNVGEGYEMVFDEVSQKLDEMVEMNGMAVDAKDMPIENVEKEQEIKEQDEKKKETAEKVKKGFVRITAAAVTADFLDRFIASQESFLKNRDNLGSALSMLDVQEKMNSADPYNQTESFKKNKQEMMSEFISSMEQQGILFYRDAETGDIDYIDSKTAVSDKLMENSELKTVISQKEAKKNKLFEHKDTENNKQVIKKISETADSLYKVVKQGNAVKITPENITEDFAKKLLTDFVGPAERESALKAIQNRTSGELEEISRKILEDCEKNGLVFYQREKQIGLTDTGIEVIDTRKNKDALSVFSENGVLKKTITYRKALLAGILEQGTHFEAVKDIESALVDTITKWGIETPSIETDYRSAAHNIFWDENFRAEYENGNFQHLADVEKWLRKSDTVTDKRPSEITKLTMAVANKVAEQDRTKGVHNAIEVESLLEQNSQRIFKEKHQNNRFMEKENIDTAFDRMSFQDLYKKRLLLSLPDDIVKNLYVNSLPREEADKIGEFQTPAISWSDLNSLARKIDPKVLEIVSLDTMRSFAKDFNIPFVEDHEKMGQRIISELQEGKNLFDPEEHNAFRVAMEEKEASIDLLRAEKINENFNKTMEAAAENFHNKWAKYRIEKGWKIEEHPELAEYKNLSDSQKEAAKNMTTLLMTQRFPEKDKEKLFEEILAGIKENPKNVELAEKIKEFSNWYNTNKENLLDVSIRNAHTAWQIANALSETPNNSPELKDFDNLSDKDVFIFRDMAVALENTKIEFQTPEFGKDVFLAEKEQEKQEALSPDIEEKSSAASIMLEKFRAAGIDIITDREEYNRVKELVAMSQEPVEYMKFRQVIAAAALGVSLMAMPAQLHANSKDKKIITPTEISQAQSMAKMGREYMSEMGMNIVDENNIEQYLDIEKRVQSLMAQFPDKSYDEVRSAVANNIFGQFDREAKKDASHAIRKIKSGGDTYYVFFEDENKTTFITEGAMSHLQEIAGSYSQSPEFQIEDGQVYGFVYDGKIYMDPDLMNLNTPAHEYTHLWDKYTRETNPELWAKGMEAIKGTELWDAVTNDPAYASIADNDDLVLSEAHSRLCGNMAEDILTRIEKENGGIAKDAVIDWNKEAEEYIAREFGEISVEKSAEMTPENPEPETDRLFREHREMGVLLKSEKDELDSTAYPKNSAEENWKIFKDTVEKKSGLFITLLDEPDSHLAEKVPLVIGEIEGEKRVLLQFSQNYDPVTEKWYGANMAETTPTRQSLKELKAFQKLNKNGELTYALSEQAISELHDIYNIKTQELSEKLGLTFGDDEKEVEMEDHGYPQGTGINIPAQNMMMTFLSAAKYCESVEDYENLYNNFAPKFNIVEVKDNAVIRKGEPCPDEYANPVYPASVHRDKDGNIIPPNEVKYSDMTFSEKMAYQRKKIWEKYHPDNYLCISENPNELQSYKMLNNLVEKDEIPTPEHFRAMMQDKLTHGEDFDVRKAIAEETGNLADGYRHAFNGIREVSEPNLYSAAHLAQIDNFIETPFQEGLPVPPFTKIDPETGRLVEYSGFQVAALLDGNGNPAKSELGKTTDAEKIVLRKVSPEGAETIEVDIGDYNKMISAGRVVREQIMDVSLEKDTMQKCKYAYEDTLGLNKDKMRDNTAENFEHNVSAICRTSANSVQDAMLAAKSLVDKMPDAERAKFEKTHKYPDTSEVGAAELENKIAEIYGEAKKEHPIEDAVMPSNTNFMKLKTEFKWSDKDIEASRNATLTEQGAEISENSGLKIGDTVEWETVNKRPFTGFEDTERKEYRIASCNSDTKTVVLVSENLSEKIEAPMSEFVAAAKAVVKEAEKEEPGIESTPSEENNLKAEPESPSVEHEDEKTVEPEEVERQTTEVESTEKEANFHTPEDERTKEEPEKNAVPEKLADEALETGNGMTEKPEDEIPMKQPAQEPEPENNVSDEIAAEEKTEPEIPKIPPEAVQLENSRGNNTAGMFEQNFERLCGNCASQREIGVMRETLVTLLPKEERESYARMVDSYNKTHDNTWDEHLADIWQATVSLDKERETDPFALSFDAGLIKEDSLNFYNEEFESNKGQTIGESGVKIGEVVQMTMRVTVDDNGKEKTEEAGPFEVVGFSKDEDANKVLLKDKKSSGYFEVQKDRFEQAVIERKREKEREKEAAIQAAKNREDDGYRSR